MARSHLVWDWNGTLLDDLSLVVSSTNSAFESVGGRSVDSDEHRRTFRRPVAEFYAEVLGRAVDAEEFGQLDRIFHDAYRLGLTSMALAADAMTAIRSWPGSQSLLSMWFHDELVPAVETYGLSGVFTRVDVASSIELERDYGDRVPVVLLDGTEHGYWRVEEARLLRDLARPPGAPRL